MGNEKPEYLSYLLRLWRGTSEEGAIWRASLESSTTRARIGFASLDELFDFLRNQTGTAADEAEGDRGTTA